MCYGEASLIMRYTPETVMIFGDGKQLFQVQVLNRIKPILPSVYRVIKFLENSVYLKLSKMFS